MEQMDLNLEQRVWDRIGARMPEASLADMERRCLESAGCYRQMAQAAAGRGREQLGQLARGQQEHARILRGIRILEGEEPGPISGAIPEAGMGRRNLALAVRRCEEARANYLACAQGGRYSPVFAAMAAEEGRDMGILLGMIGQDQSSRNADSTRART